MALLSVSSSTVQGEPLLLGSGSPSAIKDVATCIQEQLGLHGKGLVRVGALQTPKTDRDGYYFDMKTTFERLGWAAKHDLESGIAKTCRFALASKDFEETL